MTSIGTPARPCFNIYEKVRFEFIGSKILANKTHLEERQRGNMNDFATILEKVFENRIVGLGGVRSFYIQVKVGGRLAYLVVDLTPSLTLKVVMFKSLKTINADVEICGIEN